MTQAERLARRDILQAVIKRLEDALVEFRADEARTLEGCEHTYADGRAAATGGSTKVCAICGHQLKGRDDKLWG